MLCRAAEAELEANSSRGRSLPRGRQRRFADGGDVRANAGASSELFTECTRCRFVPLLQFACITHRLWLQRSHNRPPRAAQVKKPNKDEPQYVQSPLTTRREALSLYRAARCSPHVAHSAWCRSLGACRTRCARVSSCQRARCTLILVCRC